MLATKRDLMGRRIEAVNFHRFLTHNTGQPRQTTTDPILTLDNGRKVWFVVAETETGEYGIEIAISERRPRHGKRNDDSTATRL